VILPPSATRCVPEVERGARPTTRLVVGRCVEVSRVGADRRPRSQRARGIDHYGAGGSAARAGGRSSRDRDMPPPAAGARHGPSFSGGVTVLLVFASLLSDAAVRDCRREIAARSYRRDLWRMLPLAPVGRLPTAGTGRFGGRSLRPDLKHGKIDAGKRSFPNRFGDGPG